MLKYSFMPTLKIMSINRIDIQELSAPHVILIPIRSFSDSKSRLTSILSPEERTDFIIKCAKGVILATGTVPTVIVTSDPEVHDFAIGLGCYVIKDNGVGLNDVVHNAFEFLRLSGIQHVTIAHGDLPLARDLTSVFRRDEFTIVPDRKHDGTNVMSLPALESFQFSYGPMSFNRHLREAERLKLRITVYEDPKLAMDVDTPEDFQDLLAVERLGRPNSTS